jgi:hypothetical protein
VSARGRAVRCIIVRPALRRAPSTHARRTLPAPGSSLAPALAPVPEGMASLGGPSPWTTHGGGLPARAVKTHDPGRTCSREAIKRSAAGQGRALRGARRLLAVSALAAAVRPDEQPTVPRCSQTAAQALASVPARDAAIAPRDRAPRAQTRAPGHRGDQRARPPPLLRRHGRQQLVSIQRPEPPGRRLPNGRRLKTEASGATAGFVDK